MSICKDVNVDLLNKCFELAPFHGLHVPHPDDITEPPELIEAEDEALPDGDGDDADGYEEEFDEGINRTE